MVNLLKNVVASIPLGAAVLVGYTAQPILFVAKKLTAFGIFLHENLQTNLGKEITKKRSELNETLQKFNELKQRFAQQTKAVAQQTAEESSESRLANIVKTNNNNVPPQPQSNVFILGKKDEDTGNKT